MNNYEQVIDEYRKILLQYKKIDYEKRLELCEELYNMLYLQAEMYQGTPNGFDKESKLIKDYATTRQVNDARISDYHNNFFININNASGEDMYKLIKIDKIILREFSN